ncbi:hypothetical protein Daus18300_010598 [Diaporthe australafricana]|uniref:Fungal STAND N-terminal Goodbye domain-containing protein n=1 Tax=Diaporthe australafricana TaxID=127596 RepID=A0ABR3WA83_9PEZI
MAEKDRARYHNDGARDVVDIWSDAIRQYQGIGGKDLKAGFDQFKSVDALVDFGCKEMESFHAFRYDGAKVSKLRGLFKDSMWLVEGGMQQVVAAATPAFPPAAAVGTALTYMLSACKEVSADYDIVTTFFVDFTMFLRRMKILEKRLPKQGAFHDCVYDVFASLLKMCGIATKYIQLKRFKKWVTALFKGGDDELVCARSNMDTAMSNLQDATQKAILGNTVELQESSGETQALLEQMEQELQENAESSRRIMEEQFSMLQEITEKQNTIFNDVKKLLQFEQERRKNESLTKQGGPKSSGNAKPPTSNSVRISFGYSTDPDKEYQTLRHSRIPETGTWIFEEPGWKAWVEQVEENDHSPILTVSGPRGAGKSHLAASIYDHLKSNAGDTTCVVHFYFREDTKDLDEFCNAINWAVVQIAERNANLCDRINKTMAQDDLEWDYDNWEDVWSHFVKPLFPKSSKHRLTIVLDGIDELPALVQRDELLDWLKAVKSSNDSNISVVCTLRDAKADENDLMAQVEKIGIESINVARAKQGPDTRALIWQHLNSDNGLNKFDPYIKQRIATRVEETADCMLYAEHMLRHFSMIGREHLVLKQLKQKRPPRKLEALKSLLAWLSFSFRPLTLSDSLQLVKAVFGSSLDLESELQGNQLARVLKIAGKDERESSDTDKDSAVISGDKDPDAKYNDSDLPLKFLGRSMRDYFQQAQDVTEGLRTPAPVAHRKIFLLCCDIICGRIKVEDESLRSYAARTWSYHLSWTDLRVDSNGDTAACLEGLGNIMTNAHDAASFFQRHGVDYEDLHSDFKDEMPVKDFQSDLLFQNMAWFADLISKSTSDLLSQDTRAWAKMTMEDMKDAFMPLAKAHINKWLHAADVESAATSYKFSRTCIGLTGQNALFKKTIGSEDSVKYDEEEILGISGAFDNASKTGNAAWAVASILEHSEHYETALTTLSGGAFDDLSDASVNSDNFRALHLLAIVQNSLEDYEAAQESIIKALSCQDGSYPGLLRGAYITQAEIYTNLDNADEAIKSYESARQATSDEPLRGEFLRSEFDAWNKNGKAVDLVKTKWTLHEKLEWMAWNYASDEKHHVDFMFAAIDAKEFAFVGETYEEIISLLDNFDAGVPLRNTLAHWHYLSSGDLELPKTQTLAVLDSTLNSSNSESYRFTNEDPEFSLYRALSYLTDIIYEQFRATADRSTKAKLFEEAKGLMGRPLPRAVVLQKSWQVYHKVILARMARKLGPLHDFEQFLDQGFNDTLEALMDGVSWNDELNLDLLSQVLFSLDGLEREGKIALSARFSQLEVEDEGTDGVVDGDKESSSGEIKDDDGDGNSESDDGDGNSESSDEDDDPLPDDEGDLTGDSTSCAGSRCDVSWRAWKGRRIYQCLYCWDTFLCDTCYDKRIKYNEGAEIPPGEHYCGKNHKYISGPVQGWKGIKNGMVLIEGEEPFAFKTWLADLKEKKWPEAWEKFWMD